MGVDVAATQFGPYLIYERLGVGGMATVHRALERGIEGFERIVALKRLLPHLASDGSFIKSFVREAKLASILNHVNIVQIYELGRVGTAYFISMEYIEGYDIRGILKRADRAGEPPPLDVTCAVMLQLCDALDYAHGKRDEEGNPLGLVHRDLSPSNLLITRAGHLKVIDFGIAKAQASHLQTQTGGVKGKLAYMAPEAIAGKELDSRSDLFAVGVIMHELLTGRPLFACRNDFQTLLKIQREEILPPSATNTACPKELDAIVMRLLAPDPRDRFASAADVRQLLLDACHQAQLQTSNRELAKWLDATLAHESPHLEVVPEEIVEQVVEARLSSPSVAATPSYAYPSEPPTTLRPRALSEPPTTLHAPVRRMPTARGSGVPRAITGAEPPSSSIDVRTPHSASEIRVGRSPSVPSVRASGRASRSTTPSAARSTTPSAARSTTPSRRPRTSVAPRAVDRADRAATSQGPVRSSQGGPTIGASLQREARRGRNGPLLLVGAAVIAAGIVVIVSAGGHREKARSEPPAPAPAVAPAAAAPAVTAARGTVKFVTEPADAEIIIEGAAKHAGSPWTTELSAGTHQVQIQREGRKPWLTTIELAANETQTLRVVLESAAVAPGAIAEAMLDLSPTPSGLEATLDGKPLEGKTPIRIAIQPGNHVLTLRKDGAEVWRHELAARAGVDYAFHPTLTEERRRARASSSPSRSQPEPAPKKAEPPPPPVIVDPVPAPPPPPVVAEPAPPPPPVEPAPAAAPAGPVNVTPAVMKALRVSGTTDVQPPAATQNMMMREGRERTAGTMKVCIGPEGAVASVSMLVSTRYPAYDERLIAALRGWRFRPYAKDGVPSPACSALTIQYSIK